MKGIRLAERLTLPLSVVTAKTAILAKSGAGKSNTAKVIVEGALGLDAQVVILDPVGHWWGLRSLFPIPVLGGESGDLPLDHLSGKLIAQVVVESGQSLVLDVSNMDSDGQMQRFVKDFAKELYRLKQAHPTAMLLVLEEADEFAPQDTRGDGVTEMVGAIARIAKRGRGRGIGLLSVTLRSAALSKNVLNQSDNVIAMRTTAPLDIKAVDGWLKYVEMAGADAVVGTLPGLQTGEAWLVSPETGVLDRVRVVKARSLDTSATPKVGDVPATLKRRLKPINLAALGEQMQATVERARENDPADLRRRASDAEAKLAAALRDVAARPTHEEVAEMRREIQALRVELESRPAEIVTAITDDDWSRLEGLVGPLTEQADRLAEKGGDFRHALADFASNLTLHRSEARRPVEKRGGHQPTADGPPPTVPPPKPTPPAGSNGHDPSLSGPQRKILDAIAWWRTVGVDEPRVGQVGFLVGYHERSKGFTNNLSALSTAGMIERGSGTVALTAEGAAYARTPEAQPTDQHLQQMIYDQIGPRLTPILQYVLRAGRDVTLAELGEAMGYHERSKGFTNNVSRLSGLGLLERPKGKGIVRASSLCFIGR